MDELSLEERTEAALAYAISGDWKHAVAENQAIIDANPTNTEAANRLGKAFIELNKPRKAEEAYQLTLDHDPGNAIARKNLDRLVAARKTGARGLRSIMEAILLEPMFELPGLDGVEEIVINREVVEGRAQPLYIYTDRREDLETSA